MCLYLPFLIIALFQDWENAAVSQQELSTAGKYGEAARPDGEVSGDDPDHGDGDGDGDGSLCY